MCGAATVSLSSQAGVVRAAAAQVSANEGRPDIWQCWRPSNLFKLAEAIDQPPQPLRGSGNAMDAHELALGTKWHTVCPSCVVKQEATVCQ